VRQQGVTSHTVFVFSVVLTSYSMIILPDFGLCSLSRLQVLLRQCMAAVLTFSLALFCTTENQMWVCVSGRCSGQSLLFTLPACSINDTPRTLLPELCTPLHLSCTSCAAYANRFIFWQRASTQYFQESLYICCMSLSAVPE
jgi:hypothetical protein